MKSVSIVVCGAGKELLLVVLNHLQPTVEIIGFRMGELRGLSRWRSHYLGIGLDETLVDNAVIKAGMLHVKVEQFIRVLSYVMKPDDFEFASDYISFQIPDDSFVDVTNCIAVVRGLTNECEARKTFGRILLCIPPGHCFVDLALFEDDQIAMLLNKMNDICEGLGDARMMILQAVTFHLCILQEPIVQITESCTN
ncbi:anaphase-promoting complex subunit 4-like isoform X1 [Eucalyptus grandis]|uniref:anaphase-promoting complex subunit 4-like isoform X1 n=1 Tax=Eucalyptus grandis TaxID=71139 RepID=UPI00192EFC2F|nr:anaphase-promoting complex subunit 4-like isoform X1 [Eucalyptus grandis]XP_039167655.1 anaphase-promoting complex subunit 4-like isoform X1 [Eucalyptus grandis]XP_039167656.1 anaphase-promoting complex subunit 4-like isoform X1 [Eucalyptus grandis]